MEKVKLLTGFLIGALPKKKAQQARGTCWARSDEPEAVVARESF
jgi:hypothetical protein